MYFVDFNMCNQICKLKTSTSAVTYHLKFHPFAFRKASLPYYTVIAGLRLVMTIEAAEQILMYLTSLLHRYVYKCVRAN